MNILLRKSQHSHIQFIRKVLFEAVYWRANDNKPSFEEGLVYPDVRNALADWGKKDGDTGVDATNNSIPIGAAWYRFWTDSTPFCFS
jgi:hypothetical protein